MLFAWLMWATVAILRAARTGSRGWWIFGGLALGASVFVHPTAPLYAVTAFGCAVLYAPRHWRTVVREAWPGAIALLIGFGPYYAKTLHVLSDRYGVGQGSKHGGARTFSGNPVWDDALHFVAPGPHDFNYFSILALLGLLVLVWRRSRVAIFCVLTVLAPVVFFSVVPATGRAALFFDRYMIPVTPAFLVIVCTGCLAIASRAGRAGLLVFVVLDHGADRGRAPDRSGPSRRLERPAPRGGDSRRRPRRRRLGSLLDDGLGGRGQPRGPVQLRPPGDAARPVHLASPPVARARERRRLHAPQAVPRPQRRCTGSGCSTQPFPQQETAAAAHVPEGVGCDRQPAGAGVLSRPHARRPVAAATAPDRHSPAQAAGSVPFRRTSGPPN